MLTLTEYSVQSDSFLAVLNPEQREAVIHEGSPLLILAGAGSGKTRVITTKIAYLIAERHVDPASILAVTFTKKAAQEMQERAVQLEPRSRFANIRTFHSFGAYFLRRYAEQSDVDKNFTVYDDDATVTLLTKAVPGLTRQQAAHYAHKIALAKDYCLLPESKELYTIDDDPHFASVYDAYQKRLRDTGNVDFGDLILKPFLLLKENAMLRHNIHLHYRVIMVDEYQDSNVAQFKLLQQLAGVAENTGTYVCVVGDDDQSIYKFRGAMIQNILNFQSEFPGTALIRLQTNYRSTAEILSCADAVVKNNRGRLGKTLVAARGKGKRPVLAFLPTQEDESAFCADLIEQTHSAGVPYTDWAILYRTNAQSLGFETEFLHRKIPYVVVGSLKFYEREEIKDILAWLSFVANPRDEVAFRRIVNKPPRGIGATSQDKLVAASAGHSLCAGSISAQLSKKASEGFAAFCGTVAACSDLVPEVPPESEDAKTVAQNKTLAEFVSMVIEKSGLEEFHKAQDELNGSQRYANLQELCNSATLYPCTRSGLLDFLDHIELDRTLESASEARPEGVTLITLHNTKGLEFPRVVITGMESGVFPREDKIAEDLEEERRLFYVGITRAQNELYFTSCALRRLYGRTAYMSPSPFLHELGAGQVRVIGDAPFGFASGAVKRSNEHPLAQKWCVGAHVFHDDWGSGQIISAETTGEQELVVTVSFDSGGIKKFLPQYQAKSLLLISDE